MKIFQIGFNEIDVDGISNYFFDQGYTTINWDKGNVAYKMMENFKNGLSLLNGYEHYDCFCNMENVNANIYAHLIFFKLLDEQYPGSKFILNTSSKARWLKIRCSRYGYMERYIAASGFPSKEQVISHWQYQWDNHHANVLDYFGQERLNKDLLILSMDHDENIPLQLFLFLSNPSQLQQRFLTLYTDYSERFTNIVLNKRLLDALYHFLHIGVYVIHQVENKRTVQQSLQLLGLNEVTMFPTLTNDDLAKDDYRFLSTIYLSMTPELCNKCNIVHDCIYEKSIVLQDHLSYMFCLRHSLENTLSSYTLILEDSIEFTISIQELHMIIHEFIEKDLDVLYLGFSYIHNNNHDSKLYRTSSHSNLIMLPNNQVIGSKKAILYKKHYIEKLFSKLLPLSYSSDVMLSHIHVDMDAKICIPKYPVLSS